MSKIVPFWNKKSSISLNYFSLIITYSNTFDTATNMSRLIKSTFWFEKKANDLPKCQTSKSIHYTAIEVQIVKL